MTKNTSIPELSDDQIASMRFAVMSGVGEQARAKTHRYRRVFGGVVVGVALASIGAGVAGSLPSLSGGSAETTAASTDSDVAKSDSARGSKGDAGADASAGEQPPAASQDEKSSREIITTGSVMVTVSDPRQAAREISQWVETIGGRVDERSETAAQGDLPGNAHLTVRIPQDKVMSAIDDLSSFGKVDNVSIRDDDVTAQGTDLDARIAALRLSVDRLEDIMRKSDSSTELIRAESALTERQGALESLVAERKGLSDQVALSSISIDLASTAKANSVSPTGFWGGLVTGWNSLVAAIDATVHGLGVILPWLMVLGSVFAVVWLTRRRRSASPADPGENANS